MKNILQFPNQSALEEEESALWLVRLDRGNLSDAEKDAFRAWLQAKPNRAQVFEKHLKLWGAFDSLSLLEEVFPLKKRSSMRRNPLSLTAAGMALAACLIMAVIMLYPQQQNPATQRAELSYQTAIGQQSRIVLEDGSVMTLNTDTVAKVAYSKTNRTIHLLRGEGHFEVAKNPQRPFTVYAGDGYVKALGTAFSVRLTESDVDILVSEGVVEVVTGKTDSTTPASAQAVGKKTVILSEKGAAHYSKAIEHVAYLPEKLIQKRNAWQRGKWVFEGDELADVLAEAQRYTTQQISLADPAIGKLKVGGVFKAGDVDSLLRAIATGFDVVITAKGGDNIELSLAQDAAPSVQ